MTNSVVKETMNRRPLRIATWYNLPSGGAKRALYNHLAGLKARGHVIEAFRPPVSQIEFMPISEVSEKEHEFPWPDWAATSWFFPRKVQLAFGEANRYIQAAKTHAEAAAKAIDQGKFDILFANTDMQFHAPHVGRYLSLPKLLYLQEPNRPLYEAMPRLPWMAPDQQSASALRRFKSKFSSYINIRSVSLRGAEEVESARSYDRILVNSFFSRECVLRAYGLNSKVCYLGINPGMFSDLSLPRENFVMGVGTLGPSKNVLLAVRAVGQVPKELRPKLVWVANMVDRPYAAECVQVAKELGVDFEPKEMIPDDQLVSLLNRAKLMVYAPRLEPFGFAPLEANLCGLPVIGVAEGGVRETVVDGVNGRLVDHDPPKFGQAITQLLQDDELRDKLAVAGKQRVLEEFGLEASIDRLEDELYEVADSKR